MPAALLSPVRVPCLGVTALTLALTIGCSGPAEDTEPDESAAAQNLQESQDACRTRLDGAIRRLEPDSLRSITRLNTSVGALNAWLVECAAQDLQALEVSESNLAYLDPTAHRAVSAPRYTVRDAAYIRDSMLASRLAQALVERAAAAGDNSETARLLHVFRWVGNNISLRSALEAGASEGFLDTLLLGRGSVYSRVWVLATVLRQLQRDVVILVPGDGADDAVNGEDSFDEFLLAVCLDDGILLFDPKTWLPVPVEGDDSVWIDQPAGAEYLQASEAWQQPGIRMIAETSTLCPRLLVLQERLPADASAMLYEELAGGTSEIRPLVERVVASAPDVFDASRIRWWNWPDQQVTAAAAPDEQQRRVHDALMKPFEAPFEREAVELDTDFTELLAQPGLTQEMRENLWAQRQQMEYQEMKELEESGDSDKLFGRPSSRLLRTRLTQVEGSSDRSIIQQLQKIRNACIDDAITFSVPTFVDRTGTRSIAIPEAIRSVNQRATGSALYWIGICQLDRDQPGTAITSFASYRRQYPGGSWFYPSLLNQAVAEYRQGRLEAAVATLSEANQDNNPEQAHVAMLLSRLQATIDAADDTAEPADSPSTDAPPEEAAPSSSEPAEPEPEPAEPASEETEPTDTESAPSETSEPEATEPEPGDSSSDVSESE